MQEKDENMKSRQWEIYAGRHNSSTWKWKAATSIGLDGGELWWPRNRTGTATWKGKDSIIFSKNVVDASQFQYSKGGCFTRWNCETAIPYPRCPDKHICNFPKIFLSGPTETIVDSFPGGASQSCCEMVVRLLSSKFAG